MIHSPDVSKKVNLQSSICPIVWGRQRGAMDGMGNKRMENLSNFLPLEEGNSNLSNCHSKLINSPFPYQHPHQFMGESFDFSGERTRKDGFWRIKDFSILYFYSQGFSYQSRIFLSFFLTKMDFWTLFCLSQRTLDFRTLFTLVWVKMHEATEMSLLP